MKRSVFQFICIPICMMLPMTVCAQSLTEQYTALVAKQNALVSENARLQEEITKEQEKLTHMQNATKATTNLPGQVENYLKEVAAETQKNVGKGLPFDRAVRLARVQQLQKFLSEPRSVNDKFRRTMEVLLIESQYGTTIETYPQQIELDGNVVLVTMVRLGNVGLYYTTLNQKEAGYFNKETGRFEKLSSNYIDAVIVAGELAQKRRPAELIVLPVGKVVER